VCLGDVTVCFLGITVCGLWLKQGRREIERWWGWGEGALRWSTGLRVAEVFVGWPRDKRAIERWRSREDEGESYKS
jgi:hypothetical protein